MASGRGPIRRAQLIAPFGVGAMFTSADGSSLICAGLDYWLSPRSGMDPNETLDEEEFVIREWRLERALGVEHFLLPPDHRRPRVGGEPNTGLTIPFFRFPTWAVCPRKTCRRLQQIGLTDRGPQRCKYCERENRKVTVVQVPFVAMCERGHLQDFPWREWVHHSVSPTCEAPMRLKGTGGASLAAQKVECECGHRRSLAGITSVRADKTVLSSDLDPGIEYLCRGHKPWLGRQSVEPCGAQVRGSLRNASNVYFADVRSAIYLPRADFGALADLRRVLDGPRLAPLISTGLTATNGPNQSLIDQVGFFLTTQGIHGYDSEQVRSVLEEKWHEIEGRSPLTPAAITDEDIRRGEFEQLRQGLQDDDLSVVRRTSGEYSAPVAEAVSRICLVNRLKETRVLAGFARVNPVSQPEPEKRKALLWKDAPGRGKGWLPAYTVFGEGIFLEFSEERLAEWERRPSVVNRVNRLLDAASMGRLGADVAQASATPRYLLLHTFSHLLMNGLTFECGYSTAALRERLYVSGKQGERMSAVLIYTASGDAEGTLGGLVRMGEPGQLEPLIHRVLDTAKWCSADPVCMESGPQGPDSCNLAACHNCSLVPETACEAMNRFLDRGLVVGTLEDATVGYFAT